MATVAEPTTAAPAPVHSDPVANAVIQLTAARMAPALRAGDTSGGAAQPLTVAETAYRAAEFGCTPWCVMDHAGEDGRPGWHQGPAAVVVSPKTGEMAQPGHAPDVLLSARVTQTNDEAEAYGIETRLWLDYGVDTVELDVDQTDQLIASIEAFLPQLRAARALLAEASRDDRDGDPVARARHTAEVDARLDAINAAEVDALCAKHGIERLPANAHGHEVTSPLLFTDDGRRFLLVPRNARPGTVLGYLYEQLPWRVHA